MIFTGKTDFCDFLDREMAEREKEKFRRKYTDAKKIPVSGKKKRFWQRVKEEKKK